MSDEITAELTAAERLQQTRAQFAVLELKLSFESPELQAKYAALFDAGDAAAITAAAITDRLIPETK